MGHMDHDDEFDEFDTPAEEISRVVDDGEPVEFGEHIVVTLSTLPKVARTAGLGRADQLDDPVAAVG